MYYEAGKKARAQNDWASAIKMYKKATDRNRFDPSVRYSGLAYAYARAGMVEDAIREYREVLTLSPYYARTHANLGALYLHLGQPGTAFRYLTTAEHLNPYDERVISDLELARKR